MSCQSCHVNPSGGGIRNAPGRYYAMSTLPMFGAKGRDYHDATKGREFYQKKNALVDLITGKKKNTSPPPENKPDKNGVKPEKKGLSEQQLADYYKQFEPRWWYPVDFLSYGYPLDASSVAEQSEYAFDRRRYGPINADPFITLGGDARFAFYSNEDISAVFPMQFDTGVAVHPVEHVTLSATTGLQGRTSGVKESLNDSRNKPVKLQNAFLLLHEFPYMSYAQAGVFLPEFGLRHDDHTAFSRRYFEMDTAFTDHNAMGVQVGLAPNYPYASAAVFKTIKQDGTQTGNGFALNAAYRGIVWGVGGSYMQKNRDYSNGGDLLAASINGYYNLWGLFPSTRYTHPMILQFEYNVGQKPRTASTLKAYSTWLTQFDYLFMNGLNLKLYHMFYDEDFKIKDDTQHRIGWGFDWTFYRGLRYTFDVRSTLPSGGQASQELIMFVHGYL